MTEKIEVGDRFEVPMRVVDVQRKNSVSGDPPKNPLLSMVIEGSPKNCQYHFFTTELAGAKRLPRVFKVGDRVRTSQDDAGWTWTIAHIWEKWAWVVPFGSLADMGGYGQIRPLTDLEPAS